MSICSITSSTIQKEEDGELNENKEEVCDDNQDRDYESYFQNGNIIEGEDTMKNLRTTFAGLFGDLK